MGEKTKRLAIIVSKGTLDMAYPPLMMATTATSLGWEAGISLPSTAWISSTSSGWRDFRFPRSGTPPCRHPSPPSRCLRFPTSSGPSRE